MFEIFIKKTRKTGDFWNLGSDKYELFRLKVLKVDQLNYEQKQKSIM